MYSTLIRRTLTLCSFMLVSVGALSAQDVRWQVRLRGIAVLPDEKATISVINGDVDVDNAYVPELDFTLFFTPNIAAELILATAKHTATAVGTDLGDVELGSVWLLPPTLTLQYHLAPEAVVSPYFGVGGNLTFFYNAEVAPGSPVTEIDYSTSGGFALQAGADVPLGDRGWLLNVDVKKIFLSTDVALNGGAIDADLTLDPWVIGVGLGYQFGR